MADLDRTIARNWVSGFLAHPIENRPGSAFLYNSIATFMLAAIVEKVSGQELLAYLRPRLLDPLGITEATWDKNPEGITVGGWGLSLVTESIAKFGQLYLQDGIWDGKRLLPEGWVKEATSKQTENGTSPDDDWQCGYGYQFWRCKSGCYRADGAFGQVCAVSEAKDMVVVCTACVEFMHEVFNEVWDFLAKVDSTSLPADPPVEVELAQTLGALYLPGPMGEGFSPTEASVTGHTYVFEGSDIKSMTWAFSPEGCTLSIGYEGKTDVIHAQRESWHHGSTTFEETRQQPVAASGAWLRSNTFKLTLQYLMEPASVSFTAEFGGDHVNLTIARRGRFVDPIAKLKGQRKG